VAFFVAAPAGISQFSGVKVLHYCRLTGNIPFQPDMPGMKLLFSSAKLMTIKLSRVREETEKERVDG